MKKNQLIAVGLCLLSLSACKDFGGMLSVQEKVTLLKDVDNSSSSWEEEEEDPRVDIQPGSYSAKLVIQGKKSIGLKVDIAKRNSPTFTFKTDKNLKKLNNGDRIQIASSKSGQPYDVDGVYTSETTSSDIQNGIESCTYTVQEYRCREVHEPQKCEVVHQCNPQNPTECADQRFCTGGSTHSVCGYEDVQRTGSHWVEYFYNTTTDRVNLALVQGGRAVAQFNGSDSESKKIYTRQEICR